MYGLRTPAVEVAQALLIVMRRGSLRTAEEITRGINTRRLACDSDPCGCPDAGAGQRYAPKPDRNQ